MWEKEQKEKCFKFLDLIESGLKTKEDLQNYLNENNLVISKLILPKIIANIIILIGVFFIGFMNNSGIIELFKICLVLTCILIFFEISSELFNYLIKNNNNQEWILYFKLKKVLK